MTNKHFINKLISLSYDTNDFDWTFNLQNHKINIVMTSNDTYEINLLDQNYELVATVESITLNIIPQTIKIILK